MKAAEAAAAAGHLTQYAGAPMEAAEAVP